MSDGSFKENSLVLYKTYPARVVKVSDKIEIELSGGETKRVRPKDISLLHEGPLHSLGDLLPRSGEAREAWEILAGTDVPLIELAELAYGESNPATTWAAWQLVADGLYFQGTPEKVTARSAEELERERSIREVLVAEKQAWTGLMERVRAGRLLAEDRKEMRDLETLAHEKSPKSRILRELGRQETKENAHSLLLRLGVWNDATNPHPARCEVALQSAEGELPDLPPEERRDLTHLDAFAIDDEGNQDPDDAISWDGSRLWVHVADVAALIVPDSPIDLAARARASNLYLPERIISMLPPRATELLGLGLHPISPALSFGIEVGSQGEILSVELVPSRVKVTRLTYEQAETRLLDEPFRSLVEVTGRFSVKRKSLATAQLELPEVKIRVLDGEVVIRPLPPLKSRELVTEAMLMTGVAAAKFAQEKGIAFPFTTQTPPETAEHPRDLAAMYAYRKKFQRSETKSTPGLHAGLGLEAYARTTSPLRRYLDLVAHQQLRAALRGESGLGAGELLERIGATEALIGNIRRAERLSNQHWVLVFLKRNPGWKGNGIVVESRGPRGTLIIPELGLEEKVYLGEEPTLNQTVSLSVKSVDLANLTALFEARSI